MSYLVSVILSVVFGSEVFAQELKTGNVTKPQIVSVPGNFAGSSPQTIKIDAQEIRNQVKDEHGMPQVNTQAVQLCKLQVGVFAEAHPKDFKLHYGVIVARKRPNFEEWVFESKDYFRCDSVKEKQALQARLKRLGYSPVKLTRAQFWGWQ